MLDRSRLLLVAHALVRFGIVARERAHHRSFGCGLHTLPFLHDTKEPPRTSLLNLRRVDRLVGEILVLADDLVVPAVQLFVGVPHLPKLFACHDASVPSFQRSPRERRRDTSASRSLKVYFVPS